MKSLFKIGAILTLATLLFAGCGPKMKPPTAADTLGTNSPNANWSGGSDIGGAGMDGGLDQRADGLSADLISRIKSGNVNPEDIMVTVYFDFDQYGVRGSERGKLQTAANNMQSNSGLSVVAVGYTDWYGTEQYNLALAERRAQAVKSYLENLGISGARVEILSMGKLQATPNVEKQSPEAQHDRRVDLIKMSGAGAAPVSNIEL